MKTNEKEMHKFEFQLDEQGLKNDFEELMYNQFMEQLDDTFEEGSEYECGYIDKVFEDEEVNTKIKEFAEFLKNKINATHNIEYYLYEEGE